MPDTNKLLDTQHALPKIAEWVKKKVSDLKDTITGKETDTKDDLTLNGLKKRTDSNKDDVVGTEDDTKDDLTLNGLSKKISSEVENITGGNGDGLSLKKLDEKIDATKSDIVGTEDDESSALTLNGLSKKVGAGIDTLNSSATATGNNVLSSITIEKGKIVSFKEVAIGEGGTVTLNYASRSEILDELNKESEGANG